MVAHRYDDHDWTFNSMAKLYSTSRSVSPDEGNCFRIGWSFLYFRVQIWATGSSVISATISLGKMYFPVIFDFHDFPPLARDVVLHSAAGSNMCSFPARPKRTCLVRSAMQTEVHETG